jgi:hypothetical protein
VASVYRERIAGLESRLATEQAEQRDKEYRAPIDKIEKAVAGLSGVAAEVEAAVRALPVALAKFQAAQHAALKSWPANVDLPWQDELGTARIERIIDECFRPFTPEWPLEAREHWSLERKLENIRETIAEFAAAEATGYQGMIARLRLQVHPVSSAEEQAA